MNKRADELYEQFTAIFFRQEAWFGKKSSFHTKLVFANDLEALSKNEFTAFLDNIDALMAEVNKRLEKGAKTGEYISLNRLIDVSFLYLLKYRTDSAQVLLPKIVPAYADRVFRAAIKESNDYLDLLENTSVNFAWAENGSASHQGVPGVNIYNTVLFDDEKFSMKTFESFFAKLSDENFLDFIRYELNLDKGHAISEPKMEILLNRLIQVQKKELSRFILEEQQDNLYDQQDTKTNELKTYLRKNLVALKPHLSKQKPHQIKVNLPLYAQEQLLEAENKESDEEIQQKQMHRNIKKDKSDKIQLRHQKQKDTQELNDEHSKKNFEEQKILRAQAAAEPKAPSSITPHLKESQPISGSFTPRANAQMQISAPQYLQSIRQPLEEEMKLRKKCAKSTQPLTLLANMKRSKRPSLSDIQEDRSISLGIVPEDPFLQANSSGATSNVNP